MDKEFELDENKEQPSIRKKYCEEECPIEESCEFKVHEDDSGCTSCQ